MPIHTKLTGFILETLDHETRRTPVEEEEAVAFVKEHCKSWLNNRVELYRVVNAWTGSSAEENFYMLNPQLQKRAAKGSAALMAITTKLPSWAPYPKRNMSVMMSNLPNVNTRFGGDMFVVIPTDECVFGVCPNIDFNRSESSFPALIKATGLNPEIWGSTLIDCLLRVNSMYPPTGGVRPFPMRGIPTMVILSILKSKSNDQIIREGLAKMQAELPEEYQKCFYLAELMSYFDGNKGSHETVGDYLEYYFGPEPNGFKLVDSCKGLEEYQGQQGEQEIWTSGKVLLVNRHKFNFFNRDI